jgi:predicted dehydrogenase
MLGVGIIGCGQIAELHVAAYADRSDAKIVAVADKNVDAGCLIARQLGLSETDDVLVDYRELLQRNDVDVVEILLPHHLHAECALAALAAGKHTSLQKPMAVSLEEADQLIEAAAGASSKFHVFENFIFYPPIQRAKEIVDSGDLGDVMSIRLKSAAGYSENAWPSSAEQWRYSAELCGGGPMVFDDGHHKFAIAWHFLGLPLLVHSFIQQTYIRPDIQIDCPALVSWTYASGALGSFEATYSPEMFVETQQYPQDDRIEITGTKGILWVTRGHGKLLDAPPVILRTGRKTVTYDDMDTAWSSSFINATDNFLRSIESGTQALLSAEQASEVLAFAFAAGESARTGQPVSPRQSVKAPAVRR